MGTNLQNGYQPCKLHHFLNPAACILWAGTELQFTACLYTSDRDQRITWTMLQTPPCQSIVVYFSCCCGCIQSWFASVVYCSAGCYDITRWFVRVYTVSSSIASAWYVYSSICFFLPLSLYCRQDIQFLRGPLHIRDQAPQLQHNVVFIRIDALSIAQIETEGAQLIQLPGNGWWDHRMLLVSKMCFTGIKLAWAASIIRVGS